MEKFKFIMAIVVVLSVVLACNRSDTKNEDEDTKSERFEKLKDKDEDEDAEEIETKVVFGNPYLMQNSSVCSDPGKDSQHRREYFRKAET